MSSWWGKDDKRDPRKGRDGGPKPLPIKLLRTSREKKTNIGLRSRRRDAEYGGYHGLGGKQGNTANK